MEVQVECEGCGYAYYIFDETFKPTKCRLCGSDKIHIKPQENKQLDRKDIR